MLQLTHQNLNDDTFKNEAVEILRYWIRVDRQTIARFHDRVPLIEANYRWVTNRMPDAIQELLTMHAAPGMNIESLARSLVPPLLSLGANLQHQGNSHAFRLIPILEWIEANNDGNLMTKGLLEKLSRAQREGVSPAIYL